MLLISFVVSLLVVTIVPPSTLHTLQFGQNDLPIPVAPPPFTFDPIDGNGVCNIAGYYRFDVTTKAVIQGTGSGNLQVILSVISGATTRRFVSRTQISSNPGINSSGNSMVATAQINVGDVVNVSVWHDVPVANQISFPQTENQFMATLIQ